MILLLDTSTPTCRLSFVDGDWQYDASWDSGRELAKGLLVYLETELQGQGKTWDDVTGLGVFAGPGSFTGLRIGATVANSLAYIRNLPIVGVVGEEWQKLAVQRLAAGEDDSLVMPHYGGDANITTPRK